MKTLITSILLAATAATAAAQTPDSIPPEEFNTIYAFPEQNTDLAFSHPDWRRTWINTATLSGCYITTLLVLQCLPEESTAWNRQEIVSVPLFRRWKDHVIDTGPVWDRDKPIFNFFLHPYAGAAYFMAARSNGISFWGSFLYSAAVSTLWWEFGVEAFMEDPSLQDIFITPIVGSVIGEGFFHVKRYLVAHNYRLFNSALLGNTVAFIVDPVNEVVGLFAGNPARRYARYISSHPTAVAVNGVTAPGFTVSIQF